MTQKTQNERVTLLADNFKHWILNSIPQRVNLGTNIVPVDVKTQVISEEGIFAMRVVCSLLEKFFEERGQHLPVGDMTDEERDQVSKKLVDVATLLTPYIEQAVNAGTIASILDEALKEATK